MVEQTDSILNPATTFIGRWGCYFCTLAAERLTAKKFTAVDLTRLIGEAVLYEYIFHANYKNHNRLAVKNQGWGLQMKTMWWFPVQLNSW